VTSTVQGFHNPARSDAPENTSAKIKTTIPIKRRANRILDGEPSDEMPFDACVQGTDSACVEMDIMAKLSDDQGWTPVRGYSIT
jgi:hypothetical protein